MADNFYLNVSGDWTAHANWSDGADPDATDYVRILSGDKSIDTNLPAATAGLNYAGLEIGPQYSGNLATAAAPLYVGAVTAAIKYNGQRCPAAYLAVDTGDASTLDVYGSTIGPTALNLSGAGTWTTIRVHRGCVTVYTGTTATTIYVLSPDAVVWLNSGATIANVIATAGQVYCSAAIGTLVRLTGSAVWNHVGTSAYDIGTLDIYDSARFNFGSEGGTITTVNLLGANALLDCDQGSGKPRTISTLNRYNGTIDVSGVGKNVTLSAENAYGGAKVEI